MNSPRTLNLIGQAIGVVLGVGLLAAVSGLVALLVVWIWGMVL